MITPNQYFDKIYCLNLERRNDKRKKVSKRFLQWGLDVEFINGIDATLPNIQSKFDSKRRVGLTVRSFAITKSFLGIFKRIIENKERTLVFEDDVLFHINFDVLFDMHTQQLPYNWDMWYLGGTQFGNPDLIKYSSGLVHPKGLDGFFAFGINYKFVEQLPLDINDYNLPLDSYIKKNYQPYTDKYKIFYSYNPRLCGHDLGYSDNLQKEMTLDNIPVNRGYNTRIYK